MDFDSKKANAKKYKNKQRYNKHPNKQENKEKVDTADKSRPRREIEDELPNNWSRYELSNSEEECEQNNEKNQFNALLDKPISQGSYFKFKNEENWSKTVEFHSQFQKYFTLDVNLLNAGVACVKFSERHGYNDDLIKTLDVSTEKTQVKYDVLLNKINSDKNLKEPARIKDEVKHIEKKLSSQKLNDHSDSDTNINQIAYKTKDTRNVSNSIDDDNDIDNLLQDAEEKTNKNQTSSLPTTDVANKTIYKPSNTTEDLEQWLDDILDD